MGVRHEFSSPIEPLMQSTFESASVYRVIPAAITVALLSSTVQAGEVYLLGPVPYAYAWSVSDDGRVVAGQDNGGYWYWTREKWVVPIPDSVPPGNGVGGQPRITADGTTMTCSFENPDTGKVEASLYDITLGGHEFLGSFGYGCDAERSGAWGMSRNGEHVVGLGWIIGCDARGFSWDASTGELTNLGSVFFLQSSRANAVSDDGRTIAGWNDNYSGYRQGAAWIKNDAGVFVETALTGTGGTPLREASAVSGNGQWVYGISKSTLDNGAPWRWSQATGYQTIPGSSASGSLPAYIVDANFDGTKVLAFFGMLGGGGAALWTVGLGWQSIDDLAGGSGSIVPDGWSLSMPLGMSEDGLTIVGTAWGPGGSSPFVLDMHEGVCQTDLDQDGMVGASDLAIVLSSWDILGGSGDVNFDGVVNAEDLAAVLGTWGDC